MKALLLRVLAGPRQPPDDEPLSEEELEMTIRNRLYGERGASLEVTPVRAESQPRARARAALDSA
jgi:hypothetical protein